MSKASCFFGTRLVKNLFFILADALLFDEKISQSAAVFWLDCEMLEFFKYSTHEPSSKELRIYGARLGGNDCGLCPYNRSAEEVGGSDGVLYEAA
jgi:hypothetical protein